VRATTRSGRGPQRTRLGLTVATALAIAFSLSGFALANELPAETGGVSHASVTTAVPLTPQASPTPPTGRDLARRSVTKPGPSKPGSRKRRADLRHYALPVARHLIDPSQLDRLHHDYPAWDVAVPVGTEVVAVHAGVVKEITDSGNCGYGVVVDGSDGYQYTYCHGSKVSVRRGTKVSVRQRLMLSGSSGHSTGPHLHLQIESPSGVLLCPQSLVTSWFNGGQASPDTASSSGCFYISRTPRHRHRKQHSPGQGSITGGGLSAPETSPTPSPSSSPSPSPTPSPSPSPKPTPPPKPSPSPSPTPLPLPTRTSL
jgi:murein DD-endopeptidase MepM/ murein hydrolase activator NlpD